MSFVGGAAGTSVECQAHLTVESSSTEDAAPTVQSQI